MYAIRIKGTEEWVHRKPVTRVDLQRTATFRTAGAAKTAITALNHPYLHWNLKDLQINSLDELEVVEVLLSVVEK